MHSQSSTAFIVKIPDRSCKGMLLIVCLVEHQFVPTVYLSLLSIVKFAQLIYQCIVTAKACIWGIGFVFNRGSRFLHEEDFGYHW